MTPENKSNEEKKYDTTEKKRGLKVVSNHGVLKSEWDPAAKIKTIPITIHTWKQKLKGNYTKVINEKSKFRLIYLDVKVKHWPQHTTARKFLVLVATTKPRPDLAVIYIVAFKYT